MTDNRRSELARITGDNFYRRSEEDNAPTIMNRAVKPVTQCKLCSLVPKLIDRGYTFEEATDVEKDLYRFIYTFWSPDEIARWLKRSHDYQISHDSVTRHTNQHIPDPNLAMLDRVKSYRPDFMNKKFFLNVADTMKLSLMKYQSSIATGNQEISTADFLNIAKTLKEWQDFIGELQEDRTDLFMQAVGNAIEEVLNPHPEIKEKFIKTFRAEVDRLEKEEMYYDEEE